MTANATYNSGDRFEMLEAEFPGGTMRYLAGGEGQPVLYLHGAGGLRVTPALHLLAHPQNPATAQILHTYPFLAVRR